MFSFKIYSYAFFYSFSSYIKICDPFCVNFYIQYEVEVQLPSFAYISLVVQASFVEDTILFSLSCLGVPVENQLSINLRVYFQTLFYSIDLYDCL